MTHPAFVERVREVDHDRRKAQAAELYDRMEPAWHAEASCRSSRIGGEGPQRPGATWDVAYPEEVAMRDPGDYVASRDLREFMAVCARCPVREVCLRDALATEGRVTTLGRAWFYVSHEPRCSEAECSGCVPDELRLRYKEVEADTIAAGVFGGVPGRVRAFFAEADCGACGGRGHADGFMLAGVDVGRIASEHHDKPGWPCEPCGGTGQVANPDAADRCREWFEREAVRNGWLVDTEEMIAR